MAKHRAPNDAKQEQELMAYLWSKEIADNPFNFVMFAFPWGKKGTPLEHYTGPRSWQKKKMLEQADHIAENRKRIAAGKSPVPLYDATVSGRGVGKSAQTSWDTLWMMTCNVGSTTIVTANTEQQLKSRTWAELGKWHTLAINAHWFERAALSLRPAEWFEEALKKQLKIDTGYYYAQAQLWSEENPDAFAGVHNPLGVQVIKDEASGIPSAIWKVTEGFFTEPVLHRYWKAYSNGRRNTGDFFECFHKNRNFWRRTHIDSRTVEGTDRAIFDKIIEQYGEDSDTARVEVKGEFPKQGDKQFISRDIVDQAVAREIQTDNHAGLIMGVDIARFGDDATVIRWRQGRDARSIPAVKVKGLDNMEVAALVAEWIQKTNPDAVCIDAGNGTGVIDRLRQLKYVVHEVWFGAKSSEPEWANKRTQMWADMRAWLGGGCIDDDPDLLTDLTAPEYKFQGSGDRIMLQSKEEMKSKGFASPDHADALACTFAVKVAGKDLWASKTGRAARNPNGRQARNVDYDLFG